MIQLRHAARIRECPKVHKQCIWMQTVDLENSAGVADLQKVWETETKCVDGKEVKKGVQLCSSHASRMIYKLEPSDELKDRQQRQGASRTKWRRRGRPNSRKYH